MSESGYPAACRAPVCENKTQLWNRARILVCGTRAIKKRRPVSRLPFGASGAPPVQQDPAASFCVHRLLGRGFRHRNNRNEGAAVGFCTKLDMAFDLGEQSMVGAHADIKAGMPSGAALTRNDVAGNHVLAAIGLDSEALACGISSVSR